MREVKKDVPSLLEIVENKIIPRVAAGEEKHVIVAPPRFADAVEEDTLSVTRRKLRGKRIPRRGFSYSGVRARWPEDHLLETNTPLLLVVLEGELSYCCSDYILQIPEGSMLLVPAGVPRVDGFEDLRELLGDDPTRFCDCMLFHERLGNLEIWLNHDRGNRHYWSLRSSRALICDPQLSRMLSTIQDELLSGEENSVAIAMRYLEIFFFTLERDMRSTKGLYPSRLPISESQGIESYEPIHWAQQYIRNNLSEHLTIDRVARHARLSRTQFIKRFREETGETFNGYVTRCRLEHARNMLENTTVTVRFIAESLGYNSEVHFYRLFLKHHGQTPSAYRAERQNNDQKA